MSIVDWDNDQQDEVKVISAFETNTKEKIRVRFFKKMTGALESNEIYTIVDSP